jgi:hypothetical protein
MHPARRRVADGVIFLDIFVDGAAQFDEAEVGRVMRLALFERVDAGLADVPGRVEIRFADAGRDGVLHLGDDGKKLRMPVVVSEQSQPPGFRQKQSDAHAVVPVRQTVRQTETLRRQSRPRSVWSRKKNQRPLISVTALARPSALAVSLMVPG